MKTIICFFAFLILIISACSEDTTIAHQSPSGLYKIMATVNNSDSSKLDYATVVLHLLNKNNQEIDLLVSRAGDSQKWALGWLRDKDVIVLDSADIGPMAFNIVDSKLVEVKDLTNEVKLRAIELYRLKYGS